MKLLRKYPAWDSMYMLKMMRDWCYQASFQYDKYGHSVGSEKIAEKLRFIAALIDRIDKHDYMKENKVFRSKNEYCDVNFGDFEGFWHNPKSEELYKNDLDYLFEYIRKHFTTIWD